MEKKARLAVIGAGALAQHQHLPNIVRSKSAELALICDTNQDVLAALEKVYPGTAMTGDCSEVFRNPEIDGVVIATREDTHVPLTLDALRAGKHVYVEKPLAENPADCQAVVAAKRAAGRCVVVGMNRRCAPAYRLARELLDANGGARNLHYRIADAYSTTWGRRFGAGNRIVHELCHVFDVLRFLANSEVTEVLCRSGRPDDESILLVFRSGATATMLSSGHVSEETPKEHLDAVAGYGMLAVEEFVELRTFGMRGLPDGCRYFAGHCHPQHGSDHVEEFARRGVDMFIPKTFATTAEDARRIAEAGKK